MSKIVKITGGVIGLNSQGTTTHIENKNSIIKYEKVDDNSYLLTSSLNVDGNLNFRNIKYKKKYRSWLIGEALRTEMGHDENASSPYSDPPTWTTAYTKNNHAYCIAPFSSSRHEVVNLNCFYNGEQTIESRSLAVPYTSSLFYSKQSVYTKSIYKLSASADMISGNPECRANGFSDLGLRFSGSFSNPAIFKLNVPDRGKIVDIKVWVEFMHNSGSPDMESDNLSSSLYYPASPLGEFWICLRSPNLTGFSSFPMLNNKYLKDKLSTTLQTNQTIGFWNNSMILWIGRSGSLESDAANSQGTLSRVSSWQRDRHMRTVFCDNAYYKNPMHIDKNYINGSNTHNQFENSGGPAGTVYGADKPWFSDVDDALVAPNSEHTGSGSPPQGWLTAPGGVASVNEWPTTGSNYGADYIKPVYPLLDNIVEKTINQPSFSNASIKDQPYEGYRPGLRGTEMNGDWELVVVNNRNYTGFGTAFGDILDERKVAWFRQFRLEITYKKNIDANFGINKFKNKKSFPTKNNLGGRYARITGSSGYTYDSPPVFGLNSYYSPLSGEYETEVYSVSEIQPCMTFGMTNDTGSLDFAVFSRLTGSLNDFLSGSSYSNLRSRFINNEFGTPLIPLNSGSDFIQTENQNLSSTSESRININDILSEGKKITNATRIKNLMNKTTNSKTTRELMKARTSGSE